MKYYRYYVQEKQAPDAGERWKTVTVKKCLTLEEAKTVKRGLDSNNHSNIYSYKILDRIQGIHI